MRNLKNFLAFIRELFTNRHVIIALTRQDFRSRYLGSYLGILWAFAHPTVYTLILWFVFQFGFKAQPVADFPFALWLIAAMFPWFFLSDALSGAASSILDNAFLVKKMTFSLGMLPIVKILSALVIHLFLIGLMLLLFVINGRTPQLYWLQLPYYLFAACVLVLGVSWLTSSITIFFRDMTQLVTMGLQFLFWMTPLFWSPDILPPLFKDLIKLNPLFYITQGYRESLVLHTWFWEHWLQTLYFWSFTGGLLVVGAVVFRRLRPHFADVL